MPQAPAEVCRPRPCATLDAQRPACLLCDDPISTMNDNSGSVLRGATWMALIPILLFWLPGIGGLLGGIVGGRAAGGVGSALLAWLLSSILVGALFAAAGTALSGFILIGAIAGFGGFVLAIIDSGMRLLGAIIGGLFA